MRALAVTAPSRIDVIDLEVPRVGPYDALCRMTYATICSGTDTHVIDGTFGPREYPRILGHESVGEVVEIGERVSAFRPGDHVTRVSVPPARDGSYSLAWGGMVEYGLARDHAAMAADGLPRSEWGVHRVNQVIPPGLMAPGLEPMLVTWRETSSFAHRLGVAHARRMVVSGSGANGLSFAAIARATGAVEVTLVGSAARLATASRVGADVTLSYTDDAGVARWVDSRVGTVDMVIDATGRRGSIDRLLPALRPGGTVAVYGLDDAGSYHLNPLRAPSFSFYNGGYDEAEAHDGVVELVRRGALDARAWIDTDRVFGWHDVDDAYAAARDHSLVKPLIDLRAADPGE